MNWESLMLEGYPSWEPMTFGAMNIRAVEHELAAAAVENTFQSNENPSPIPVPDDIQ